jgi:hypothetical protein
MTENANLRLLDALAFAVEAHGRVLHARKSTTFPYVVHPIGVAEILTQHGYPDDVVVAGFLHDTIEDTDVDIEEIQARFGDRVAELVAAASEPNKALPWRERKGHTIASLRMEQDTDVLALVAADKLENVRAIARSLAIDGAEKTWARFNANEAQQRWYYRGLTEAILEAATEAKEGRDTLRLARTLDYETRRLFPDPRRATMFLAGKPLGSPHDARAYLADPIKHWQPGYSAFELAHSWIGADGIPPDVQAVLDTCGVFAGCRLVEGLFEREVELGTPGRSSQTDVLTLVELTTGGYGVVAVEGKAREPFGEIVSAWNTSAGKDARLGDLCRQLGIAKEHATSLRYQLLHRTVSALREARRYGAPEALMLVHSFDPADSSFGDYQAFAAALGLSVEIGAVSNAIDRDGIALRLGWVRASA